MTVATEATLPVRRDVPIHRDAFTLSMLALLGGGVLVLLALWIVAQALSPGDAPVTSVLNETAALIDQHGDAMVEHGERLLAAARRGSGTDRDHWISDAQHMIGDGQGLHAIAAGLRSDARSLGDHPGQNTNASASMLFAKSGELRGEGTAMIAHGQAMVEHATVMAELAQQPGSAVTVADAQLMSQDAPRIVDAGRRVLGVADILYATADQLRSMLRR